MRNPHQGKTATCCPITSQQSHQIEPLPNRRAHHGEEPRKAVARLADVRRVTQQHVEQQRGPYLPADGVCAVAGEAAELDRSPIFEQWVGIELWKRLRYLGKGSLHYMRTKDGAEVDFIVEHAGELIPIEVKWTENPTASDARHLRTFMAEKKGKAKHGYVVCRCDRPMQLDADITAIPWHHL